MMGAAISESDVEEELELREDSEGEDSQDLESSSNSSFLLLELNLLFVFLSLISPNSNETSNSEDDELMKAREVEAKTTYKIARSSVKNKDVMIEAKPEGRRAHQRFHTTIKDHRHGRKM